MDHEMNDTLDGKFIPMTSVASGVGMEVLPDLYCLPIQIVNLCFVGTDKHWVLVDAGMPESADAILSAAENRFGAGNPPAAIVLTHGHFDHVGALVDLVKEWNVPVYAHELEMPYLTGESDYPEPDGTVEGGLLAKISPIYPNEGIDLGPNVNKLPASGTVPEMPAWKWVHTPGHTPGHISLFREEDRALIAGDAFITVKQESLFKVLSQTQEISGPPRYLTPDWQSAWDSVRQLHKLNPAIAITGHGLPMTGEELTINLEKLVNEFDTIAIPDYGRYV